MSTSTFNRDNSLKNKSCEVREDTHCEVSSMVEGAFMVVRSNDAYENEKMCLYEVMNPNSQILFVCLM